MYLVEQRKGKEISVACPVIYHWNIKTLEEAQALARKYGAKWVEKIYVSSNGIRWTSKIWKNEEA